MISQLGMLISFLFPKVEYRFEKIDCFSIIEFGRRYLTMQRAMFTYQVVALFCVKWCHSQPPSWKCDIKLKICQLIHIYVKNIPAKFHPDPIWNNAGLGVFEEVTTTRRRTRWAIWDQLFLICKISSGTICYPTWDSCPMPTVRRPTSESTPVLTCLVKVKFKVMYTIQH